MCWQQAGFCLLSASQDSRSLESRPLRSTQQYIGLFQPLTAPFELENDHALCTPSPKFHHFLRFKFHFSILSHTRPFQPSRRDHFCWEVTREISAAGKKSPPRFPPEQPPARCSARCGPAATASTNPYPSPLSSWSVWGHGDLYFAWLQQSFPSHNM